jgi:hypothetical protein
VIVSTYERKENEDRQPLVSWIVACAGLIRWETPRSLSLVPASSWYVYGLV